MFPGLDYSLFLVRRYFCVFSEEETSAKIYARRFADRKVRMYLYKMKKVDMHKYHVEMQKRKVP